MNIATAQADLRRAYLRGGPGAMVSGVVWFVAGTTASYSGVSTGFAVLFFGGMLIFPVASLIPKFLFGREPIADNNPSGLTIIETVFPMIGGLLAAWLLVPHRPEFVFPVAAIAVGTHYFGFRTAYGDWSNWVLGGMISCVGASSIFLSLPSTDSIPYLVAVIEFAFGGWLTYRSVQSHDSKQASE